MTVLLHDRKTIFFRPMKTGGTTIRKALMELDENNVNLKGRVTAPHTMLHHPWWIIKTYVGEETWNEYRKVSSVRNPWNMLVSLYFYDIQERTLTPDISFSSFVYSNSWFRVTASNMIFDEDKCIADDVIKLETINEDMKRVFNIDNSYHENNQNLNLNYRDMYDLDMVNHVRDMCYKEIEKFGYDFDTI